MAYTNCAIANRVGSAWPLTQLALGVSFDAVAAAPTPHPDERIMDQSVLTEVEQPNFLYLECAGFEVERM
ncbi:hypothetical protein LRP88_04671 [Fusarium phalaenopsidis]